MDEYDLKSMWKSPNGTIRAADGTCSARPSPSRHRAVRAQRVKPITIARSRLRRCKNTELRVPGALRWSRVHRADGSETRELVQKFDGPASPRACQPRRVHRGFARSCFEYALDIKQDIWFATKDTISRSDHRQGHLPGDLHDAEYAARFEEAGIEYFTRYRRRRRGEKADGAHLARKNYDGDVMSDMVSSASAARHDDVGAGEPSGLLRVRGRARPVQRHYQALKGGYPRTRWPPSSRGRVALQRGERRPDDLVAFADKLSAPRSTPSRPAR
ncbi:MAG: hypothetical protein ACLTMP_05625 [Eggerthella lenta]